jgi:hypothetical protein
MRAMGVKMTRLTNSRGEQLVHAAQTLPALAA